MSYRVALWVAVAALLAMADMVASGAAAQGRIVARHGDWQIRCERPVGAPAEQCALIQNVEAADRPNVSLTVIFLETADGQTRILRVLAPLGVLLPSGLGLSIDDNEVGAAGFVRCMDVGCIAEVELDDGLVERFEAGRTATFVIFQTPEEGIGIPISLTGFTAGFAALRDPPAETLAAEEAAGPQEPVETSTRILGAAEPAEPAGFSIPEDDRTELDRLLEDPLFPWVAGAAGGILLVVLAGILLAVRAGRRRRRRAAEDREAEIHEMEDVADHEDDAPEEEDEDLARPRRPATRRVPRRLAPPPEHRQLTYDPLDELGDVVVARTGRAPDGRPPAARPADTRPAEARPSDIRPSRGRPAR